MAMSAWASREPRLSLVSASESVKTMAQVTSEPVPLVVGIAISRALLRSPKGSMGLIPAGSTSGRS